MTSIPRTPEPITDPKVESDLYRVMDHAGVNQQFVDDLIDGGPVGPHVIDLGVGPADIPIRLLRRMPQLHVIGIDNTSEMLAIAQQEIDAAGLRNQITLQQADGSDWGSFEKEMTDTVVSNSFLHHLDQPESGMNVAVGLLKQGGRLFLRDLFRPDSVDEIERLVSKHGRGETDEARQLLRQSLHAALTLDEITCIAKDLGIPDARIRMTSDRHWTIDWTKDGSTLATS